MFLNCSNYVVTLVGHFSQISTVSFKKIKKFLKETN